MTRLRQRRPQPAEQMINIADRLAPYVDPKRGVRLQSIEVALDSQAAAEPLALVTV